MQAIGGVKNRQDLVKTCSQLSIRRQCKLVGISRSGFYHTPSLESQENLDLMRLQDELHLKHPFYGSRRLTVMLQRQGMTVNRKRVIRLLQKMGLEAIYPMRSLQHFPIVCF